MPTLGYAQDFSSPTSRVAQCLLKLIHIDTPDTTQTGPSCLVWWAGGVNCALSWLNLRNRASNAGSAHCKTHRTANTNAIDANVIFLFFSRWWPSAILMDLPKLEFLTTDAEAIYTTWETDKKHGCQPTDGTQAADSPWMMALIA